MKGIVSGLLLFVVLCGAFATVYPLYCSATEPIVEVISVEAGIMMFGTWSPEYNHCHNEMMSVETLVKNNDAIARTAIIYVNAFDDLNTPLGIYTEVVTFSGNETKTIYCPIYIPKWARSGNCHVTSTAKTLPDGVFCPEKTGAFCLLPGEAFYLTVQALTTSGRQVSNAGSWIDGGYCLSTVTVQLNPGNHTIRMEYGFSGCDGEVFCTFTFKCWEDGSLSNPRVIDMPSSSNRTIAAYYRIHPSRYQIK